MQLAVTLKCTAMRGSPSRTVMTKPIHANSKVGWIRSMPCVNSHRRRALGASFLMFLLRLDRSRNCGRPIAVPTPLTRRRVPLRAVTPCDVMPRRKRRCGKRRRLTLLGDAKRWRWCGSSRGPFRWGRTTDSTSNEEAAASGGRSAKAFGLGKHEVTQGAVVCGDGDDAV